MGNNRAQACAIPEFPATVCLFHPGFRRVRRKTALTAVPGVRSCNFRVSGDQARGNIRVITSVGTPSTEPHADLRAVTTNPCLR